MTSKNQLFWKIIFPPLGVLPLKFLHVLENDQCLLTHMTSGMGVPNNFLTM